MPEVAANDRKICGARIGVAAAAGGLAAAAPYGVRCSEPHVVQQFEVTAHLGHELLEERQVIPVKLVGHVVQTRGNRVRRRPCLE